MRDFAAAATPGHLATGEANSRSAARVRATVKM